MTRPMGGFVFEFGDQSEYGDFAAFQKHMEEAKLDLKWDAEKLTCQVAYTSGKETLEMGVKTDYGGGPTPGLFTERKVNGQWPYLAPGLERDTTLTQQGRTGRLEKNGAVLTNEPGRMGAPADGADDRHLRGVQPPTRPDAVVAGDARGREDQR